MIANSIKCFTRRAFRQRFGSFGQLNNCDRGRVYEPTGGHVAHVGGAIERKVFQNLIYLDSMIIKINYPLIWQAFWFDKVFLSILASVGNKLGDDLLLPSLSKIANDHILDIGVKSENSVFPLPQMREKESQKLCKP